MRAVIPYMFSVLLTRGLSFLVVPFVVRQVPQADFGRLEVVASLVEVAGLVFAFGLADTLARFVATAGSDAQRRHVAGEVAGTGLLLAALFGAGLQLAAPSLSSILSLGVGERAFRAALLAATVSGLIDYPLAWLRMCNRPWTYAALVAGNALVQVAIMMAVLHAGLGTEGVLVSNAACTVAFAAVLTIGQVAATGIRMSSASLRRAFQYGLPLVGGGLAMFVVGAGDRWLLSRWVAPETLAVYAIAAKFALAAPIAVQPFGLWWYPRRMVVFKEAGGSARCEAAVALGFAILVLACTFVALAAPVAVAALLPVGYGPAGRLVPWIILGLALNEACSLVNMGCYLRRDGAAVLAVNAGAAGVALAGYVLLIPAWGVHGAIAATLVAQAARLLAFWALGRQLAPLAYRGAAVVLMAGLGALAVALAPDADRILERVAWTAGSLSVLVAVGAAVGLIPLPRSALRERFRSRSADALS
jgi:O-antigen/teichoic acid export membrane protein